MNLSRITLLLISLSGCLIFAQEHESNDDQPQLSIQQSRYIEFKSSAVNVLKEEVSFRSDFIVLGQGVYGHFDMVAFDNSGNVVQRVMSENRNWRKDQGAKLKTIALSMNAEAPSKVEVSFHEMRVNSDSGACKQ